MNNIKSWFSISLSSIAITRKAICLVLLIDLVTKFFVKDAMYLPDSLFNLNQEFPYFYKHFSFLNFINNETTLTIHFIVHFIVVSLFMFDFKPRITGILTWIFGISLFCYNPLFFTFGDKVSSLLILFIVLFPQMKGSNTRIFSAISIAFFVQCFFIYFSNYFLKQGPEWQNSTALYYILNLNFLVTDVGGFFNDFYQSSLILTSLLLKIELLGPLALVLGFVLPVKHQNKLKLLLILIFISFHLVTLLIMKLGVLPLYFICLWLMFLPARDAAVKVENQNKIFNFLGAFLIIIIVYQNIFVPLNLKVRFLDLVSAETSLDQVWAMFSPSPPDSKSSIVFNLYGAENKKIASSDDTDIGVYLIKNGDNYDVNANFISFYFNIFRMAKPLKIALGGAACKNFNQKFHNKIHKVEILFLVKKIALPGELLKREYRIVNEIKQTCF